MSSRIFNARNPVPKSYKTAENFVVLYGIIFTFSDSKGEYKIFLTKWSQAYPELVCP
jgi:hypothetical protein